MSAINRGLRIESFEGEGLKRAIESGNWFVGIKNWKPANDVSQFDMLERHMLTDEVFVLLEGACTLLVDDSEKRDCSDMRCVAMEHNKVYCIPSGVWHNTITNKEVKLILVENRETSNDNSEMRTLTATEIKALQARISMK